MFCFPGRLCSHSHISGHPGIDLARRTFSRSDSESHAALGDLPVVSHGESIGSFPGGWHPLERRVFP